MTMHPAEQLPYFNHLVNARGNLLNRIRVVLNDVRKLQLCFRLKDKEDLNALDEYLFECFRPVPNEELETEAKRVENLLTVENRIFNPEDAGRQLRYPACYCIHDPEVVADVSLYGNRLQRFFPAVIIGWESNQSIVTKRPKTDRDPPKVVALADSDGYVPYAVDIRRDDEVKRGRWYLGDAYIDAIIAALTMPVNVEYFKYPLAAIRINSTGEEFIVVSGFSIERIGPSIVDEYPGKKEYTYFYMALQLSFVQNTFDPRQDFSITSSDIEVIDTEKNATIKRNNVLDKLM